MSETKMKWYNTIRFTYPVSIEAVYGSGLTTNVSIYKVVRHGGYVPHEIFRGTYEQCDRFVTNYVQNYTTMSENNLPKEIVDKCDKEAEKYATDHFARGREAHRLL